jgi:hypothetical protein
MENLTANGVQIYFPPDERAAGELVVQACERTSKLLENEWGLPTPRDCRVYVMTSVTGFMFQSAPWLWRLIMAITMPLWYFRAKRLWQFAGGWVQRFGGRLAVGVKPPRLIRMSDRRMGERIFLEEENPEMKVEHITCHELTHAYSAHLRPTAWFNEGLAMRLVDKYFDKCTVRTDTLDLLGDNSPKQIAKRYRMLSRQDQAALVNLYVRAYWLTRYLESECPQLFRDLLTNRHSEAELEFKVARSLDISKDSFWENVDRKLITHFQTKSQTP